MNKKTKPKIAVIGLKGLPGFGGAATVGEEIIFDLKDEYNFFVYSISSHTDLESGSYNDICQQIVFKSLPHKKLNTIYYYFLSLFHVLFSNYNVIHLHHRAATMVLPILRIKYPVILTTHGMEVESKYKMFDRLFSIQDKVFMRFANYITAVSKKDIRIIKKISNIDKKKLLHIPNGIRLSSIDKYDDICYINTEKYGSQYLLFSAGRIFESKGCHLFLQALIKLNYQSKILIVGELDKTKDYHKIIFELCKKLNNVELIGLIKDKKVLKSLISSSKLFVYPSYNESMSMMILEVVSLRTPIILSDIPENRDIFDDSEVVYSEPLDINNLANKIKWALDNQDLMSSKANRAFNKVKEAHCWEDISIQYKNIYEKVLDNN